MERILKRADCNKEGGRDDNNVHTALKQLQTYHKYHHTTMDWLREQHVPVVNLDCLGTAENVWEQLSAIGQLMHLVTRINKPPGFNQVKPVSNDDDHQSAVKPVSNDDDDQSTAA